MKVGLSVGLRTELAAGIGADESSGDPLLLVGFAGQSNAIGFADIDGVNNINQYHGNLYNAVQLKQQDGTNANPPVWTFYANEGVKPRTNSATLNMGIELTLARYLNRRLPNRWAFSKIGIGSTGLNDHWKKTSSYPTTPPRLFDQMITAHQDAEIQLRARMSAFVWIQGEQDATDAGDAAVYETNLTQFIADVRLVWPNLPFLIVKLHINNPGTQKLVIRAAQVAVAAAVPGVTLIDVDALALQGDNLHFTPESYLTLGNTIGAAINNALGFSNLLAAFVTTYKGRTIDVTDASTSDGGSVTAWDWDWGDGSAHDTTQNASHTYASNQQRTITLTVTNNADAVKTTTRSVRPVLPTWTVDATALKGFPATEVERAALNAAHGLNFGAYSHLWLLQDLLNQTDVIAAKTLTNGGAAGTQQAVTGFSRLAVGHSGLATNQTFNNGTMVNVNASSVLAIGVGKYNSSAAIRQLMFHGAASGNAMEGPAGTQKGRLRTGASVGASTLDWTGVVMPFALMYNRASSENVLVTPIEIIRVPFVAAAGAEFRLSVGIAADVNADFQVLHVEHWEGASAEHTVQEILDWHQAHGWPITVPGFPDL